MLDIIHGNKWNIVHSRDLNTTFGKIAQFSSIVYIIIPLVGTEIKHISSDKNCQLKFKIGVFNF